MIKTFTAHYVAGSEQNPIMVGVHLLNDMRAAGVPVIGAVWPMGVTSGELVSVYDEVFEELTFTWREP